MKKVLTLFLAALFAMGTLHAAANGDSFNLKTIDGKTLHVKGLENGIEFKEYKGKVVFLEFWGTRCPPCLISIPHYIDLTKKYGDQMAMVAIEVQGTPEPALKEFAKAKGMNYDIIPHQNALEFIDYVGLRSGWKGSIPYLVILDQEGNFVTGQTGMLPQDALEGVIKELDKIYKKKGKESPTSNESKAPEKEKSE